MCVLRVHIFVCMYAVLCTCIILQTYPALYITHIHTQQATPDELEAISSHLKSFPDTALDKPEM